MLILYFLSSLVLQSALAHREHKVYNKVLYQNKTSWCQTTAIKQVITSPGYKPKTIDNNVCVGACFSYSIPRTQPAEPGELIGPYCDSCQPLTTRCYKVKLHAEDSNGDLPSTTQKHVQLIVNCTCTSCDSKPIADDCEVTNDNNDTDDLPYDFILDREKDPETVDTTPVKKEDVPELLQMVNKSRSDNPLIVEVVNVTENQRFEMNMKLVALLKSIQQQGNAGNIKYDDKEVSDLIAIIESSPKALSDKNLTEYVQFVNVNNSEVMLLDVSQLKQELSKFQMAKDLSEKHRKFGLGPASFLGSGIEGSRLGMSHLKGAHIGMGIKDSNSELNKVDPVANHILKHHVGEQQRLYGHQGHLVTGPHGSLALEEDVPTVKEKLSVEPHDLKPNQAGIVLSYEDQHKLEE